MVSAWEEKGYKDKTTEGEIDRGSGAAKSPQLLVQLEKTRRNLLMTTIDVPSELSSFETYKRIPLVTGGDRCRGWRSAREYYVVRLQRLNAQNISGRLTAHRSPLI